MKALIKKLLRNYYQRIFLEISIKRLNRLLNKFEFYTIEDLVEFSFNFKVGIGFRHMYLDIKPSQIKSEICKLLKILEKGRLKNILEIGTADGGTLFLFSQISQPRSKIVSIDLPNGYPRWRIKLYKSFCKGNRRIYLIRRDSHKVETVEHVDNILSGKKLDFLFIDGDHSYEGVKKDFEMYKRLVKKGGIIVRDKIKNSGDVWKFWREIKKIYRTIEIIENKKQNGYGIGVIYV